MGSSRPEKVESPERYEAAMVMLSNFGRSDGGRETWAYNFIPRLLERNPGLRLKVYGLRVDGEPDNSSALLDAKPAPGRDRLSVDFVTAAKNRIPNAIAFWRGLPSLVRATGAPSPAFVLAIGSFVELVATLVTPSFRSSRKIVWLRSIFAHEKARRYPARLRGLLERVEVSVLRRADLIIANGEDTAAHYRRHFGLDVTVVPNSIDLDRWRMQPPQLETPLQVAFIGRLAAVKGISEFLHAASMAHDQGALDQFSFHVVGDGDEHEKAAVEQRDWIHYHGAIANDAVPKFIQSTDVCVNLTFVASKAGDLGGSGLSYAMLEQAAAGRVIICWDNIHYRQALDNKACYFVQQGSAQALWDALQEIASDRNEARSRASQAAIQVSQFGIDSHMQRFDEALRKLMGDAAPASGMHSTNTSQTNNAAYRPLGSEH